jgi:hypothetical protein
MWFWKKKQVPETNNTREVTVAQLWIVEWTSVYHYVSDYYNSKPQFEAFPSHDEAQAFATSLRQAEKLLKCKLGSVRVRENG